jgi:NitT/TauT family transport system substrate-binding protein
MNKSLDRWDRREFLGRMALGGAAALVGLRPQPADAEPPPETTTLRLLSGPVTCIAPQWAAKDLLRSEGFTDVQYIKWDPARDYGQVASGEVDLSLLYS